MKVNLLLPLLHAMHHGNETESQLIRQAIEKVTAVIVDTVLKR